MIVASEKKYKFSFQCKVSRSIGGKKNLTEPNRSLMYAKPSSQVAKWTLRERVKEWRQLVKDFMRLVNGPYRTSTLRVFIQHACTFSRKMCDYENSLWTRETDDTLRKLFRAEKRKKKHEKSLNFTESKNKVNKNSCWIRLVFLFFVSLFEITLLFRWLNCPLYRRETKGNKQENLWSELHKRMEIKVKKWLVRPKETSETSIDTICVISLKFSVIWSEPKKFYRKWKEKRTKRIWEEHKNRLFFHPSVIFNPKVRSNVVMRRQTLKL